MNTQPEAIRLAEVFETYAVDHQPDGWPAIRQETLNSAAAELRRLHAENEALRSALEQSVEHRLIYPGGGKELSEKLWHLTLNCVTSHTGNVVHTNKLPMQEMRAFIEHLCVLVDSPPPPQQAQQAVGPVTDEENERFSRDVSNFPGADPEATKYALEAFLKNRAIAAPQPAQQNGAAV